MPSLAPSNSNSSHEEFEKKFMAIVSERLGITLLKKEQNLTRLLSLACQKFECTPSEYLSILANCPNDSPILKHLITEITIGETYFFRDNKQMQFLRITLLPRIIAQKRQEKNLNLRIWSAGCATGEEIYTIAMLLHELLPDIDQWDLHLLGTDINALSLQKAKLAQYKKWSLRNISGYHGQQYLTPDQEHFILSPKIKDCVNFLYLNLNDNTYPSILNGTHSQDLILCRNVFIYLSKESISFVMKKFSKCLGEQGYLILGASDPVNIEGTNLIYHHHDGLVFSREKPIPNPVKTSTKKNFASLIHPETKPKMHARPPPSDEEPEAAQAWYKKAKESADAGQLEVAKSQCQKSLELNQTNKDSYFLYALILMSQNQWDEAEKALRKTLYLDRQFVEGHFQLGLLLLKKRCYNHALKSLNNALKIVKTYPPKDIVPNSQGLTFGRFSEIILTEIAAYSQGREPNL